MNFSLSANRLSLLCLALPFLHGCSASVNSSANDPVSAFLHDYAAIAFSEEGTSFRPKKLMRWCEPVSVYLPQSLSAPAASALDRTLTWLGQVDGLTLIASDDPQSASLTVKAPADEADRDRLVEETFPDNRATRRRMKNATCFFTFSADAKGCILKATVVVPAYLPESVQAHCLAEEPVQAMGLPNDGAFGPISVFSDGSEASVASARDRLIVRLHYHPSLRPGMTRSEAMATARANAPDLLAEGALLERD